MSALPVNDVQSAPAPAGSSFAWRARRTDGEVVTGTIVAVDQETVAGQLRADGLIVTAIKPHAHAGTVALHDAKFQGESVTRAIRAAGLVRKTPRAVFSMHY